MRERRRMARMGLEDAMSATERTEAKRRRRERARLEANDVALPTLFGATERGEGIIRVPAATLARLGWQSGAKVFISEMPAAPDRRRAASLLVEVE